MTYKVTLPKETFEHIKRVTHGWAVRFNATESDEFISADECVIEKKPTYESVVELLIRQEYSINDELALLRQRDTKPDEFARYNAYVEDAKEQAKRILNIE